MVDAIGWASSLILVLTIAKQIFKQWQAGSSEGVSIWLFIGAAPALVKRKAMPGSAVLALCIVAGVAATWLARTKPF